ncbi:uncharacterized protein LOC143569013 [Bidens hawaiensis]|uniref:uncharacterized protein LOC143569013 n=1 Tax=Bidens hawaiensis TaxID=980011 RepID=UPI00404A3F47
MSQLFHKILRKPINGTTIRALISHQSPPQSAIPHLVHHPQPNFITPLPESSSDDKPTRFSRVHIYPSFSFGYFLNPISSSGLPDSWPQEDPDVDGSGMIWADSVKKKRKKKMNKHKLKKLKKRLRHCS